MATNVFNHFFYQTWVQLALQSNENVVVITLRLLDYYNREHSRS